ncbi:D-aminoacyl-tRNA deacylase [Kangiella geojedonensis]|uniref:D-aminoacyl-tRNA deacylase n=1 Tax=Kangiella geojedonensis TaxID=914150 RepID=A0A0F6RB63_9GAMM|nr:D-aminoacyl-tRNA deacylase [Kangiella geojedonensis]AKE51303.1 D-tyrosyl-tRNA(Tyr) deacylase [Kangiella geojedonensis]
MIALIQRVTEAKVVVDGNTIGAIEQGLMALIGVEKDDDQATANKLLKKLLGYRVFSDEDDKMNLSLEAVSGGLLLVPQFTLAANTKSGMRPSFSSAAPPAKGQELFDYLVTKAKSAYSIVETGEFGADMKVHLINDGPVTFNLQV